MRFLIFGDVVARTGRGALTRELPKLRQEYQPDSVIINIENIAHGVGISPTTVDEALKWNADVYTTGDHAWDNKAGIPLLENSHLPIIRPANYPASAPGRGYHVFQRGGHTIAVINLQGQVFFKSHPDNPFHTIDRLLAQPDIAEADIILIDMHAEATSEKRGLGWYVDGRVSAVWGTHTHVPTADAQILPQGTGYLTDVGMNGTHHSILGVDRQGPLKRFLEQIPERFSHEEGGPVEIGALVVDIDPQTGHASSIAHIRKIVDA